MTKGIKILDVLPLSKHSYLSDINDRLSKVKKLKIRDIDLRTTVTNEGNYVMRSSIEDIQFMFNQLLDKNRLNTMTERSQRDIMEIHEAITSPRFNFKHDPDGNRMQFEDNRLNKLDDILMRKFDREFSSNVADNRYAYSGTNRVDSGYYKMYEEALAVYVANMMFSYIYCLRVPEKMINPRDERYNILMDNLPRASVHDIRILANKLHMVVIPVEFSHPDIMFGDNEKLRKMFNLYSSNGENMYMMCPINYYSNIRHIQHNRVAGDTKKDMYIPDRFLHIFESIDITMSTMELMFDKIDNLEDKMKSLDNKFDQLARRVKIIEDEVFTKRETTDMGGSIQREAKPVFKYQSLDPMLISIPKGENINEFDGETPIYMLWGDDLPDILLENKNLEVFKENAMSYPEQVYDWIYEDRKDTFSSEKFNIITDRLKSYKLDTNLEINDFILNYFLEWSTELEIATDASKNYTLEVPRSKEYYSSRSNWSTHVEQSFMRIRDICLVGNPRYLKQQVSTINKAIVHAMIRIMKDIDPSYFENKGE